MKTAQKKWICLMLLGTMLCCVQPNPAQAKEDTVSPMYVQSNRCFVTLSFRETNANCTLTVTGKKGSSKISGLLMLYDSTTGKTVKNWTISKNGSVYSGSKTATAKKGHLYKLSFSGKVYGRNSKNGESVSSSTSKKN